MEWYESTCSKCRHRWQWTGYKTGIGKTPAQLEEMRTAGKTCPRCGGPATVGLDHTSEAGREINGALGDLFGALVQKAAPPPNLPPAPTAFSTAEPVVFPPPPATHPTPQTPHSGRLALETFHAVQAALLNSECSPREAVTVALKAVAQFADAESVLGFTDLAKAAWIHKDG